MGLETERLQLRNATMQDTGFIYELLNSPGWVQFIGDKGITSHEKAKAYIQNTLLGGYDSNGFGLFAVSLKEKGIPIGLCGFLQRDYLEHPDLGFAFLPAYEGKGYAFEAASALMQYGSAHLHLNRVLAICLEANKKSLHLLGKLGFKKIDRIRPNDGATELLLYST